MYFYFYIDTATAWNFVWKMLEKKSKYYNFFHMLYEKIIKNDFLLIRS